MPHPVQWIAQENAKRGEPVKVVGFNESGTVNLTHHVCIAADDVFAGAPLNLDVESAMVWMALVGAKEDLH